MPRKGKPTTYHAYRAMHWEKQPKEGVNFHSGKIKDEKFSEVMLQPKKNLFFKDIWHCPDLRSAKKIARNILEFGEVNYLELKGTWVWVDFDSHRASWILPDQPIDKRETIRGR